MEVKTHMLKSLRNKLVALFAFSAATATVLVGPAGALATESETAKKVKEVATNVGSEGVEIVLIILTALVSLLVAIIIIPKAIGLIKRFI